MLGLILTLALSQSPQHRLVRQPNLPRASGRGAAAFEFAGPSGAGMTAACACATPTGAKGEVMTFTRASSGTCLKGNWSTGIANGDMVTCSTDQARVMPGGDGTGPLGLLAETTKTNLILRSQEMENAAWTDYAAGVAAAVVTANQATGPDTTTMANAADRIQFTAASGANACMRVNAAGVGAAGSNVCSLFIKGNGTSGAIDLVKYNFGAATNDSVVCSYNASTWTRCSTPVVNTTSTTFACYFGNGAVGFGVGNRAAADVFIIGVQGEAGEYASSYIATTAASVTRAVDVDSIAVPAGFINTTGSAAATVISLANVVAVLAMNASPNNRILYVGGGVKPGVFDGTNVAVTAVAGTFPTVVPTRLWSSWSVAGGQVIFDTVSGSTGTSAFDGDMMNAQTAVGIGYNPTGAGSADGVIKQVCIDGSTTRCR